VDLDGDGSSHGLTHEHSLLPGKLLLDLGEVRHVTPHKVLEVSHERARPCTATASLGVHAEHSDPGPIESNSRVISNPSFAKVSPVV